MPDPSAPLAKALQARRGVAAHLPLQEREPAERLARGTERLRGPAPEGEVVVVAHDAPVAEGEQGADAIDHRAPGAAEGVAGGPARGGALLVAARLVERHLEIGGP